MTEREAWLLILAAAIMGNAKQTPEAAAKYADACIDKWYERFHISQADGR